MEQATQAETKLRRVGRPKKIKAAAGLDKPDGYVADGDYWRPETAKNQAMALRIWEGQSPDVPVWERVRRIQEALVKQGLSPLVELPHPEAGRYL